MLHTDQINLRDPFVLTHDGKYYLYGSRGKSCWGTDDGTDVYVSEDLCNWEGPIEVFHAPEGFWSDRNYWAPEVHEYDGAFYLFMSFKAENICRGTQILKADSPTGPFRLHSDGPVTPREWECLDGTLYVSQAGEPYIVFCHEWTQVHDGEMCACKLKQDLSAPDGEAFLLFRASQPAWASHDGPDYVTDGPFLYRMDDGQLVMIWSSLIGNRYIQAVSRSSNGEIDGIWTHDTELLFERDGGHGMIFHTVDGKPMLTLHQPNTKFLERPKFFELTQKEGNLKIV